MKMRYSLITSITIAIFSLICAGCASTYQPTAAVMSSKNNMTRSQAVAVFRKVTIGDDGADGVCGGFDWNRIGKVTVSSTGFNVKGQHVTHGGYTTFSNDYMSGSITTNGSVGPAFNYAGTFKQITKARMQKSSNTTFCGGGDLKGSTNFQLYIKGNWWMLMEVAPMDRDRFIAALMVLAPKAELKTGAGL